MSDVDNARARAEAMNEPAGRALRSARRAQLWAGLNRYLASEAAHASRPESTEDKAEREHRVENADHREDDAEDEPEEEAEDPAGTAPPGAEETA